MIKGPIEAVIKWIAEKFGGAARPPEHLQSQEDENPPPEAGP